MQSGNWCPTGPSGKDNRTVEILPRTSPGRKKVFLWGVDHHGSRGRSDFQWGSWTILEKVDAPGVSREAYEQGMDEREDRIDWRWSSKDDDETYRLGVVDSVGFLCAEEKSRSCLNLVIWTIIIRQYEKNKARIKIIILLLKIKSDSHIRAEKKYLTNITYMGAIWIVHRQCCQFC